MRRHVENLVSADAGVAAAGDVAHGVAAAAFGGKARRRQRSQRRVNRLDHDAMHLNVLARGDMQNAIAELFRDIGQRSQLMRQRDAGGKADA